MTTLLSFLRGITLTAVALCLLLWAWPRTVRSVVTAAGYPEYLEVAR